MSYPPREIRDVIHGFVSRSEVEEAIIDSTVFQRLRNIKQLAMANLVYPGALHTRFDHSIGVMNIASKMANHLGIGENETLRTIRFAALLHDIGHGPFSHVSEQLLNKYSKANDVVEDEEEIHELITCDIVNSNEEISSVVSSHECEKIIDLISGNSQESRIKSIITGPLDADKQDYLLRDSYYCGVKYGVYDNARLLNTLDSQESGQDKIIVLTEGGVFAVEQFILSKYHMSTQVYRHKIRIVTDNMIVRGLELGIDEDNLQFLSDLYKYDRNDKYITNYLQWNDSRLVDEILYHTSKNTYAYLIFKSLLERKLFKRIFHCGLKDFEALIRNELSNINKNTELKNILAQNIAEKLSSYFNKEVDEKLVLIVVTSIKSVRSEKAKDNIGSMLVKMDDGELKDFTDCSTLFKSINDKERDEVIEIYAPIKFDNDLHKNQTREKLKGELSDIVSNNINKYLNLNN